MVEQATDAWGRIDILVNVAGNLRDRMIFNMAEEEAYVLEDLGPQALRGRAAPVHVFAVAARPA